MTEHRKHASAEMRDFARSHGCVGLFCLYCGMEDTDPQVLAAHIRVCEKHPFASTLRKLEQAEERIAELEEGLSGQAEEGGAEMTSEEQARDWHRRLSALPAEAQEWAAAMFRMVEEAHQIGFEQGRQAERESAKRIVSEVWGSLSLSEICRGHESILERVERRLEAE